MAVRNKPWEENLNFADNVDGNKICRLYLQRFMWYNIY